MPPVLLRCPFCREPGRMPVEDRRQHTIALYADAVSTIHLSTAPSSRRGGGPFRTGRARPGRIGTQRLVDLRVAVAAGPP